MLIDFASHGIPQYKTQYKLILTNVHVSSDLARYNDQFFSFKLYIFFAFSQDVYLTLYFNYVSFFSEYILDSLYDYLSVSLTAPFNLH